MAKQDDYTRYTIRIPTPLYDRVKEAAGEKSVNAEIVATLEEKYPTDIFDFGTLIAETSLKLNATDDPEKMRLLVVQANSLLDEHDSEWRFWLNFKDGLSVTIVRLETIKPMPAPKSK